jgi:hypothetical protein
MSIFSKIPWKIIGGFVPEIAEIVKQANGYAGDGKDQEFEEFKKRVIVLEVGAAKTCRQLELMIAGGIVLLLISVAGLSLGIIAIAR